MVNASTLIYADDVHCYSAGNSILDLIDTTEYQKILNKLTLNVAKTQRVIFHRNKEMPLALPNVTLAGVPLRRVTSTNFLGIHMEFLLNCKSYTGNRLN